MYTDLPKFTFLVLLFVGTGKGCWFGRQPGLQCLDKEQRDFLLIMGEQAFANRKYRTRLRQLGEQVTDSEEEGEETKLILA
ncbi:hypothetical protein DM01DRAFT_326492 [Hesseltinella vesiculosa]|uniref:Uncharacterized protein n=1 Tax=Hesseltinella vesiculosa TaxID=101127 RepID=A0A1X2GGS6_9FUNG|nr:hypothetical protein DM01DRAFT_326492 [Hesseltinella vesiculosa]